MLYDSGSCLNAKKNGFCLFVFYVSRQLPSARYRSQVSTRFLWGPLQISVLFSKAFVVLFKCALHVQHQWPFWDLGGGLPRGSVLKVFHILFWVRSMHLQFGSDPKSSHTKLWGHSHALSSPQSPQHFQAPWGLLSQSPSQCYALLTIASVTRAKQWEDRKGKK